MNKKPELFVNKIDKELRNNEKVYYSKEEKSEAKNKTPKRIIEKNINQKINSIFSSPDYVYKAEVKIKFKDREVIKKVVGRNHSNLITMDNEVIPIKEIIDIEKN